MQKMVLPDVSASWLAARKGDPLSNKADVLADTWEDEIPPRAFYLIFWSANTAAPERMTSWEPRRCHGIIAKTGHRRGVV